MIVPQLDLGSEYRQLRVEIDGAVQRVLASGNFIGGAENDALEPVYHQFVVTHPRRNELQIFLAERDIATAVFYPIPCHLQPAFSISHAGV